MALLLTLVWNEDLDELLAKVPQGRIVAYLEGRGWERREANKVPGISIWEFKHPDVETERRFFDGVHRPHCHVLSVPAPHCFAEHYTDVGRRCWELINDLACLEQRSPVALICEIWPKACDWLDQSMPCKKDMHSPASS